MPLLGTTPSENNQTQHRNRPDDISDILGTRVYQGYIETLLQTLDGIIVNQPKRFLPLAEEAKHIAEEIRIEKINEQWAGIPHEQLLNISFTDQLNSNQILEQLTPSNWQKNTSQETSLTFWRDWVRQIIFQSTNYITLLRIVQTIIIAK